MIRSSSVLGNLTSNELDVFINTPLYTHYSGDFIELVTEKSKIEITIVDKSVKFIFHEYDIAVPLVIFPFHYRADFIVPSIDIHLKAVRVYIQPWKRD